MLGLSEERHRENEHGEAAPQEEGDGPATIREPLVVAVVIDEQPSVRTPRVGEVDV